MAHQPKGVLLLKRHRLGAPFSVLCLERVSWGPFGEVLPGGRCVLFYAYALLVVQNCLVLDRQPYKFFEEIKKYWWLFQKFIAEFIVLSRRSLARIFHLMFLDLGERMQEPP